MAVQLPPCPPTLKSIQHYLKTASEHDGRDPVISYWCRLYALQTALKIDKKSDEAKILLMSLMEWLEREKKRMGDNEAVTNDVAGQAHIENYALKLFLWADGQDRNSIFNKNVVKAFYTAGFLMDVLTIFGEQTEEVQQNCKYAKWKAAYIHNCLRSGETPVPGPMGGQEDGAEGPSHTSSSIGFEDLNQQDKSTPTPPSSSSNASLTGGPSTVHFPTPTSGASSFNLPTPPSDPSSYTDLPSTAPAHSDTVYYKPSRFGPAMPMFPAHLVPKPFVAPSPAVPAYDPADVVSSNATLSVDGAKLQPDQIQKAQKYCKWAGSALNYDDVPEAITNLQKALNLLTTGQDS